MQKSAKIKGAAHSHKQSCVPQTVQKHWEEASRCENETKVDLAKNGKNGTPWQSFAAVWSHFSAQMWHF